MSSTFVAVIVVSVVLGASFSLPISHDLETVQLIKSLTESEITVQLSKSLTESEITMQLSKSLTKSEITVQFSKSLTESDVTGRVLDTGTVHSLDEEIKPDPSFSTETVLKAFKVSFEADHVNMIKREVFTGIQTQCPKDMFKSFGRCLTKKEYDEIEKNKPVPSFSVETLLKPFTVSFEADHVKRNKREIAKGGQELCPKDMVEYFGRCLTKKKYDNEIEGDDYVAES